MGKYKGQTLPWRPGHMHRMLAGNDKATASDADMATFCAMHGVRVEHVHDYFASHAPARVTQHELAFNGDTFVCHYMIASSEITKILSVTMAEVKSWIVYNFL